VSPQDVLDELEAERYDLVLTWREEHPELMPFSVADVLYLLRCERVGLHKDLHRAHRSCLSCPRRNGTGSRRRSGGWSTGSGRSRCWASQTTAPPCQSPETFHCPAICAG
jgi:hypothetical protein